MIDYAAINAPRVEPVAKGINRPFWSVMIPVYSRGRARCADDVAEHAALLRELYPIRD